MNRTKLLKIINPILFILILSQGTTGLGHEYIPGELFEVIHFNGGRLIILFVIIHLALNWGWVKSNYFKKS